MLVPIEVLRGCAVALDMTRADVADAAGLSLRTVRRAFEGEAQASLRTLTEIRDALLGRGASFLPADARYGPGVLLPPQTPRRSARALVAARAAVRMRQDELAADARTSARTVVRLEGGQPVSGKLTPRILQALQRKGVTVIGAAPEGFEGFRIRLEALSRDDLRF